ncbi:MAG: Crp/Fnr family transcriptional regulator [Leptolyngbyaceae cyanobacterium]
MPNSSKDASQKKQISDRPEHLNRLLKALPEADYARLVPHFRNVTLSLGQILYEPSEPVKTAYFPNKSMISLVQVMENGGTVEAGIVGNNGVASYSIYLGGRQDSSRAIVQIAGSAIALDASILKAEFDRGESLQKLLLRYTQALLAQVSQTAACNRFHPTEERLARWLLQSQDFARSATLELTQDFLANMLGTRRASVTVAAGTLQKAGLIEYSRGLINILNRKELELVACECYGVVREEYDRLLGIPVSHP